MQHPNDDLADAFLRLQQSLRSYFRKRVSDATLAEDLLQDVFVKALTSKQTGRQIANVSGWLFTVARTTLIDHYRAVGHPTEVLDDYVAEPEEAEELQLHAQVARCVEMFIAELPPRYRETLVATDLEGERMRSLAEKQAVSVSAIKSRAARGRAMLKEKLLECCRVEMAAGWVSDCHRISSSNCKDDCL